jgi:hypothetical protein
VADPVPVANWMHVEDGKITRIRGGVRRPGRGRRVVTGAVVYAACIGPLAHIFVPLLSRPAPGKAAQTATSAGS